MSSTSLVEFRDNKADSEIEFGNSWGGAARIWNSLFDRYVKDPNIPYDNWLNPTRSKLLWDLAGRDDVPLSERAVLAFTFDHFIIRRENFAQLAKDMRAFVETYPLTGIDHLPAWADVLESSTAEAIGLHATSVNQNPWFTYDKEAGEYLPADLTKVVNNEIYEELRSPSNFGEQS